MRRTLTYAVSLVVVAVGAAVALAGNFYLGSVIALAGAVGAYVCARKHPRRDDT